MSFQATAWAFDQEGLTPVEKLTLICLADMANAEQMCWPGQSYIASKCGVSRSWVNKVLGSLEEKGLIVIEPQYHNNGAAKSACYHLMMPPEENQEIEKPEVIGWIYVVETIDAVKVGITRQIDERIRSLNNTTPNGVALRFSHELEMREARAVERRIIEAFADHALRGEWFSCTASEIVDAVRCELGEPPCELSTQPLSTEYTTPVNSEHTHKEPSYKPSSELVVVRPDLDELATSLLNAGGDALNTTTTSLATLSQPLSWLAQGADLELDVLPTIRRLCENKPPGAVNGWGYFTRAIAQAKAERESPLPEVTPNAPRKRTNPIDATLKGMLAAAEEAELSQPDYPGETRGDYASSG